MIAPLDLQSERFVATGNVASEGVLNQIGRPRMDHLEVLLREAVQNAWDARASHSQPVRFAVRSWTLSAVARNLMRDVVLSELPPGLPQALSELVGGSTDCRVLELSDRGTVGLDGPTRADTIEVPGESRNFLNLLRNVGQPTQRQHGAGTFGFGKAALYLMSKAHAICVHSRCRSNGAIESRFMVSALGSKYQIEAGANRGIFTGRHWWGRRAHEIVDPVRGEEVDSIARALGLAAFDAIECGTTILILAPRIEGDAPARDVAEILMRNCWPKMLAGRDGLPSMVFDVLWDGVATTVPSPRHHPRYGGFCRALDRVRTSNRQAVSDATGRAVPIRCEKPKKHLGMLGLQRVVRDAPATEVSTEGRASGAPPGSDDLRNHIALLRRPELVVKYLAGPPSASEIVDYAGVFLVDGEVDAIFARSEPPTHDDWTHQALDDPQEKTFIRVALRRVQENIRLFMEVGEARPAQGETRPLGMLSGFLGELLSEAGPGAAKPLPPEEPVAGPSSGPAAPGPGPSGGGGASGPSGGGTSGPSGGSGASGAAGGGRGSRPRTRVAAGAAELVETADGVELHVPIIVTAAAGSAATMVEAMTTAVLDGDVLEREPPQGAAVPLVRRWVAGSVRREGGNTLELTDTDPREWVAIVAVPDDSLVDVTFSASSRWP